MRILALIFILVTSNVWAASYNWPTGGTTGAQGATGPSGINGSTGVTGATGPSVTVGTIDSQTPSSDGAVVISNVLYTQSASTGFPGLVGITGQYFAGNKTFTGQTVATQFVTIINAPVNGMTGTASTITTGDPHTIGLTIHGTADSSGGYGPAAPASMVNITSGASYSSPTFTGVATADWSSGGDSVENFTGDGYTECSLPLNQYVFCGLSSTNMVDDGNTYLYTGFSISAQGGSISIYNEGSLIANGISTQGSASDVFHIERSGTSIIYKQNGSTIYTQAGIVSSSTSLFGAYATDPAGGQYVVNNIVISYGGTPQAANMLQIVSSSNALLAYFDSLGNLFTNGVNNSSPQTNFSGSSGTLTCSEPEGGSTYKLVSCTLSGYTDTGTNVYTYPVAFTAVPQGFGDATGVAGATITTTAVTFTVTTETGVVFIGGY